MTAGRFRRGGVHGRQLDPERGQHHLRALHHLHSEQDELVVDQLLERHQGCFNRDEGGYLLSLVNPFSSLAKPMFTTSGCYQALMLWDFFDTV